MAQLERVNPMAIKHSTARLPALKPALKLLDTKRFKGVASPIREDATPRQRGRQWMERRKRWLRANPLCCQCEADGLVVQAEEVDHTTPLWKGGQDAESNYQSLCRTHHKAKTAAEAAERARLDAGRS